MHGGTCCRATDKTGKRPLIVNSAMFILLFYITKLESLQSEEKKGSVFSEHGIITAKWVSEWPEYLGVSLYDAYQLRWLPFKYGNTELKEFYISRDHRR